MVNRTWVPCEDQSDTNNKQTHIKDQDYDTIYITKEKWIG
jgi:hypothetical protein